ncbi:MAG TPA: hypothetical protein VHB48_11345 [Chitinophagaceae bacterium]|nr:hypothetical protein [Chitinophagaceae bacterium]
MKKISAILLLAVLLFNLAGYRLLFSYLDNKAVADMVQQLDRNHYSKHGLIEIKIAMHLPYTINSSVFDRYDASIKLNGISYNCVERKITNDTLVLHCLPNNRQNAYRNAENEYAKNINDLQPTPNSHKNTNASLLIKGLVFVYNMQPIQWQVCNFAGVLRTYQNITAKMPADVFSHTPGQPPEIV